MIELKPCRFCGENVAEILGDDGNGYFVECGHCWARGPIADTKAKAARLWNRRVKSQRKSAQVSVN